MRDKLIWPVVAIICSATIASGIYLGLSYNRERQTTKVDWRQDDPILPESPKGFVLDEPDAIGAKQAKERDNVTLEIVTVEVMVDQLEKMPQSTEDQRNAWAQLFMDIEDRFSKIVTYETSDNLNLWKLIGRWATAEGVTDKSPYADAPLFHIQRLRPDYQKDEELMRLIGKLNAIARKESVESEMRGYRNFVFFFEEVGNGKEALRWANGGDEPNAVSDELKHRVWEMTRTGIDYRGRCSYIKGEVYALGIGDIEQDLARAKELFEESYRKGHVSSAFALAAMYMEGIGVPVNVTLADQWKSKAISGFPRDMLDNIRNVADQEIKTFAKRLREASTR